jgi:hypothetical protein
MKKSQFRCRSYKKPEIEIIDIEPCCSLLEPSWAGGHNKAGDDNESLGAKQAWFDEDSEEPIEKWETRTMQVN